MGYNKFITKGGTTLLDLTSDDITEQDVRQGVIFHGKDGEEHTGEVEYVISITKAEINDNGELTITRSDDKTETLGKVVGSNGIGIKSIEQTTVENKNIITITLNDDTKTTFDIYNGINGIDGKDGENGKSAYELAKAGGYAGAENDFNTALANILSKQNTTLGLHTDGLIYLFVNGVPVGAGIPQGQNGDVFGYVDNNKNIVLQGDLAKDTYVIKYELNDGSIINIGNLRLDSDIYYAITNNLTNCINNNADSTATEGSTYTTEISSTSGYRLSEIKVLMNGIDITSTVWQQVTDSKGTITISNVTGDIIISAIAEKATVELTNLAIPNETATGVTNWNTGGWCNNSRIAGTSYEYREESGKITTNTFDVNYGDTVYVKGIVYNSGTYPQAACFNASGGYIKHNYVSLLKDENYICDLVAADGGDYWYFSTGGLNTSDIGIRSMRIAGIPSGSISNIIITRNQPIE
jgi:hypothetical protein